MSERISESANQRTKLYSPGKLRINPSSFILILFISAFALFFSLMAVQQHHTFQTNGLDLGNVDQALWNTAHGRFLHFTLMTPIQSRLALHVEPILLLFVPLYWLNLGRPETLLIIQAIVVALGAWPLYQVAVKNSPLKIHNLQLIPCLLLIFPLAYLLLPTLESAILFDFHAVTLAPTFFLFAFWMLEQKKNRAFIVFLMLAMACKEDMPLVAAMIGLYVGLARQQWRLAGLVIGMSALWFGIAVFIIQPQFAAGGNIQLDRYAWLGDGLPEMAQTLLTQPVRVFDHLWNRAHLPEYLFRLFFPTAFLALFSPLTLLPMLPSLAVNLLSDNAFTWRLEDFHYGAPLAPFLFISAIYGINHLSRILNHITKINPLLPYAVALLLLLVFTGIYHFYRGFTPLARPFDWPQKTGHHQALAQIISTLPPSSALFAQSNLAPHLTHREVIYSDFATFTDPAYPAPAPVDDILLDITTFENSGGLHQFLREELLSGGTYQLLTARDGILHLQPSPATPISQLPPTFYTFARPGSPPAYQLPADFGDVVRLRGYTLHFNRQEEVEVTVDLEALQPLLPDLQPVLYLLDATAQPIGATTDLQSAQVWFPPDQWPPGEIVRIRFNTLPWYTREMPAYRLALGVGRGSDAWNISHRLPPAITHPTELTPRLPAGGSLVELAQIEQVWSIPEGGPALRQFDFPGLPHSLEANFDRQLKLLGHTTPHLNNDTLTLELAWQAVNAPENLVRFVQLIGPAGGPQGVVYGQTDSAPDYGTYPTYLWQPGEVVVETVTFAILPNRPQGNYTLHIGLYHPDSSERLPLTTGGDHVEIPLE